MIPIGEGSRAPIFPIVTYAIIAANVYVFFQEFSAPDTDAFINAFAAIPYDITHDIVLPPPSPPIPGLTLLSSMFLHGGLLHIFFNMLFLAVFGPEIEYLCGHVRYLIFYLVCGLLGGFAQVAVGPDSHVPAIGASGAIAGVLGAYLVNFPTRSINTIVPVGCFPLFLRLPAILVIGLWALTQFINGFGAISERAAEAEGGIAYFAHIGGFLAGVILIGFFRIRKPSGRRFRYYY
jgi:membrane associated rhomboid family serine protease